MELAEKYRPRTLSEVRGNRKAVEELRGWALNWPADKKAALLYGKPGTGKTSAAIALANDLGWRLLELNASDKRTQGVITHTVGEASRNASFLNDQKLILLDEIDNLHGNSDRGGAKAVTELVRKTRQPVILTANDLYGVSSTLRGHCKLITFSAIREDSIRKTLVDIWHNERRDTARANVALEDLSARLEQPKRTLRDRGDRDAVRAALEMLTKPGFNPEALNRIHEATVALEDLSARLEQPKRTLRDRGDRDAVRADYAILERFSCTLETLQQQLAKMARSFSTVDGPFIELIAKNARGDLRSAITDFQAYVGSTAADLAPRDRSQSAFDLVRSIFKDKDPTKPLNVSYAIDETPEDTIHWIDENLPRALTGKNLGSAFETLRTADIYLGRTRRRQHYGLWKYAIELMTSGINVAAQQNHQQRNVATRYSPPTVWMRLGQTRSKRAVRDLVASKIAQANHMSVSEAREEMMLLYKELAKRDPSGITVALDLAADELAYLLNAKKDSAVIKKALQEAQKLEGERLSRELSDAEIGRVSLGTADLQAGSSRDGARAQAIGNKSAPRGRGKPDEHGQNDSRNGQKFLDEF